MVQREEVLQPERPGREPSQYSHQMEDLLAHLRVAHSEALESVASLLLAFHTEEERLIGSYNEAIAEMIRQGAPLATYSIDRRCLYNYSGQGNHASSRFTFFCKGLRVVGHWHLTNSSTGQSNSRVCAWRPKRKHYTRYADTSRNSLETDAHVADLQHWPIEFPCARLPPHAETLHPPCGNI